MNFREKVWPLPVRALLYVGRSTRTKLQNRAVLTIGDLANRDIYSLQRCTMLFDRKLTGFNPKDEHVIYPVSYFK